MAEICVVHMDLMAKGGGEAVAMNVIQALQDEHDVTLVTLTRPDFEELNAYFDTDVTEVDVEVAGVLAPTLNAHLGLRFYILQNALLSRYARRSMDGFDLSISTINELGLPEASIEYVHFPFDWAVNLDGKLRDRLYHPTIAEDGLYERICTRIAGISPDDVRSGRLLANSGWTAEVIEDAYGVEPTVVYPPIDTSEFDRRPWDQREAGFVTIGRIERSKRILELVEILDGVRDRGYQTHLHVVGPTVDRDYADEVTDVAASRPYVCLEGEISRSELVELVCSHRYGIHGKRYEHFGMAVAELVAGGAIPFVPATGGQAVIVDDRHAQTYESTTDAVEKIARVLGSPARQSSLRPEAGEIQTRFGRQRFHEEIRTLVRRALGKPTQQRPEPVTSA